MRQPQAPSDFSLNSRRLAPDTVGPHEPELGELPEPQVPPEDTSAVAGTGTTTIGIRSADGVVVATDMRASLRGGFVANKNVQKVEQIHPRAVLTMVGSVGGAQSFIRTLRVEANLYETRRGEEMSMEALSTLAANFVRAGPYFAINPILGGVDDDGGRVYSIDPAGGVMTDDYAATGSGLPLAYGVLEQEYEEGLSVEGATRLAARGIQSAVERDAGSGDGVFVATVTDEGVDIRGHKDFEDVL